MKSLLALLSLGLMSATVVAADKPDTRLFEMRVYYAKPGKLDALNARFRDHTLKLFAKHGMTSLGYFVPINNTENKLVYFLAFADRAAHDAAWKAFGADPDWKAAAKESEKNGKLIDHISNTFLTATEFSALAEAKHYNVGVFELRTYTTEAGRLPDLNARFRDHTLKLFEKHGMTNVSYWNLADDQKGAKNSYVAGNTLIYLLTHKSEEAAKASFDAFRADPAWVAAKEASEKKAGGSLTIAQPNGVKSEFLVPTDYSPIK
ncbi:MAG: NIPSNAP family protein [Verrucomicrobia bacterium]|nr:NIPSNAP family protein [Verrucomicrobiota bacterium]NBS05002.1 NIPSNAP family protein [Verrucomicrobiota bacterium]NBY36980.1 NIPSNAP family protein [Verrucomicrobiota bacterium]